jgi:hypothetical protein
VIDIAIEFCLTSKVTHAFGLRSVVAEAIRGVSAGGPIDIVRFWVFPAFIDWAASLYLNASRLRR